MKTKITILLSAVLIGVYFLIDFYSLENQRLRILQNSNKNLLNISGEIGDLQNQLKTKIGEKEFWQECINQNSNTGILVNCNNIKQEEIIGENIDIGECKDNGDGTKNCPFEKVQEPKKEVPKQELKKKINVSFNKSNSLIICGHGLSKDNENQKDPGASSINERQRIKDFVSKLNGFTTYGCNEDKSIGQKLHFINELTDKEFIFEIHFDKKGKDGEQIPLILFAGQTSEKEILNWERNTALANEFKNAIGGKSRNAWGLELLNSSKKPTIILEVGDPELPGFEKTQEEVLKFLQNL